MQDIPWRWVGCQLGALTCNHTSPSLQHDVISIPDYLHPRYFIFNISITHHQTTPSNPNLRSLYQCHCVQHLACLNTLQSWLFDVYKMKIYPLSQHLQEPIREHGTDCHTVFYAKTGSDKWRLGLLLRGAAYSSFSCSSSSYAFAVLLGGARSRGGRGRGWRW